MLNGCFITFSELQKPFEKHKIMFGNMMVFKKRTKNETIRLKTVEQHVAFK